MKQVDIIGTCLTRELFNYTKEYKVNTYIMQQSIYTSNSKPYKIEPNQIKITDNYPFKIRMLYYDLNKIAFDKLKEKPSEYLIIDLADQTRDIIILKDNDIKLTHTSSMIEVLNNLNIEYSIINIDNYTEEELSNFIKKFTMKILMLYDSNKIILNKMQLQNEYYENNEKKYIDKDLFVYRRRKRIEYLEQELIKNIPNCKVLETKYPPLLDINHRLGGPYPAHFEKIYYKYRMESLDALINDKDQTSIDIKYYQNYLSTISKIKRKIRKK